MLIEFLQIIRPMNKADHAANAELFLKALKEITKNSDLDGITGMEISDGDYNAIGVVVCIMFAEGQRLWADRIRRKKAEAARAAAEGKETAEVPATSSPPEHTPVDSKKSSSADNGIAKLKGSVAKRSSKKVPEGKRIEIKDKEIYKFYADERDEPISDNNQSTENGSQLAGLMERIRYLEQKLQESTGNKSKIVRPKTAGGKKRLKKGKKFQREIPDPLFVKSPDAYDDDQEAFPKDNSPVIVDDRSNVEVTEGSKLKEKLTRRVRPSSAPVRRIKQQEAAAALARIGAASPVKKKEIKKTEVWNISQARPTDASLLVAPPVPVPRKKKEKKSKNESEEGVAYTYDLNGRKIVLTDVDKEAMMRWKQRKEAMAAEGDKENDNNSAMAEFMNRPSTAGGRSKFKREPILCQEVMPERTVPEWPSARVEKSAEEFVRKQLEARKLEKGDKERISPLRPRMFGAYEKLENLDLIFSIEYCHNCKFHNISLRHDPQEYINHADQFLKHLARLTHENRVCARVGVTRFEANITQKTKTSDLDNRIGAFEIQVAYRSASGALFTEILHSKLQKRSWPSKTVIEKRLNSFLGRINPIRISDTINMETSEFSGTGKDGMSDYPIGCGPWLSTPISLPEWTFGGAGTKEGPDGSLTTVQWAFDTRSVADIPKFSVGTTVWVTSSLKNFFVTQQGTEKEIEERHNLLGVVKKIHPRTESEQAEGTSRRLVIKLKYRTEELTVSELDCVSLNDVQVDEVRKEYESGTSTLPKVLETVLSGALRLDVLNFFVKESDDIKDDNDSVLLSRTSFFNQVRFMAAQVEDAFHVQGENLVASVHNHCDLLDLQLVYSEHCLDFIFDMFGGLRVNTDEMLQKLRSGVAHHGEKDTVARAMAPSSSSNSLYLSPGGDLNVTNDPIAPSTAEIARPDSGRSVGIVSVNQSTPGGGESPFPFLATEASSDSFDREGVKIDSQNPSSLIINLDHLHTDKPISLSREQEKQELSDRPQTARQETSSTSNGDLVGQDIGPLLGDLMGVEGGEGSLTLEVSADNFCPNQMSSFPGADNDSLDNDGEDEPLRILSRAPPAPTNMTFDEKSDERDGETSLDVLSPTDLDFTRSRVLSGDANALDFSTDIDGESSFYSPSPVHQTQMTPRMEEELRGREEFKPFAVNNSTCEGNVSGRMERPASAIGSRPSSAVSRPTSARPSSAARSDRQTPRGQSNNQIQPTRNTEEELESEEELLKELNDELNCDDDEYGADDDFEEL